MKVLLVRPRWPYPIGREESTYNRIWPPLELANCAALLLSAGFETEILDAHALRLSPLQVARRATDATKVFVTSSSLDRWQCPNNNLSPFLETVHTLRQVSDEVYAMGFHGTVSPERVLRLAGAKAVIRGEPELTTLDIARDLPLDQVRGVAFLTNGSMVVTPSREPLDLSALPIPAFNLLPLSRYYYEVLGGRFFLFEASRGCPYRCIFCSQVMYGSPYRAKGSEQLIAEVEAAVRRQGARSAYFFDLEFTLNRPLVEALCRFLISRRIPLNWCCQTRADALDGPLLRLMRRAGCSLIHCGIESGSPQVLERLNKRMTLDTMERGVRMIQAASIRSACFFMFGFPEETETDIVATIRFARRLDPTYASFHVAVPYPGTPLADRLGSWGGEDSAIWFRHPDAERVRQTVRRALARFYFRPSAVLRRVAAADLQSALRGLRLLSGYFVPGTQ